VVITKRSFLELDKELATINRKNRSNEFKGRFKENE
jgi:hypothetical protein